MLSIKKATQVTQANAAKLVQYWKTSAQVIVTPAKKFPASTPVFIADNPTAQAAKMAKIIPAQRGNITSEIKKNMMPPVKNAKAKRVNIPA